MTQLRIRAIHYYRHTYTTHILKNRLWIKNLRFNEAKILKSLRYYVILKPTSEKEANTPHQDQSIYGSDTVSFFCISEKGKSTPPSFSEWVPLMAQCANEPNDSLHAPVFQLHDAKHITT